MAEIYRVTRQVKRAHYGAWTVGALKVKTVTKRSLSAILKSEQESFGGHPPLQTIKIERAPVGDFEDVTEEFLT